LVSLKFLTKVALKVQKMSKGKQDNSLVINSNNESTETTTQALLHPDLAPVLASYLSIKELARISLVSKYYKTIFHSSFQVDKALTYVVEHEINLLKELIKEDPSLLFQKHPRFKIQEKIYYNFSAYQLMSFLRNKHMQREVMSLSNVISVLKGDLKLQTLHKNQTAEMDCGGADIIKLDQNPEIIRNEQGFAGLTKYTTTYTLLDGTQPEFTFPLLENPDGIICYQDENEKMHFYYANKETEKLQLLDICIKSEDDEQAFEQFNASFSDMENNSARRSSEEEHKLIANVFYISKHVKCSLVHNGLFYKYNGILYRDNCTPFNLVSNYRQSIRLYKGAINEEELYKADEFWCNHVKNAQSEVIWLLQKLDWETRMYEPAFNKSMVNLTLGWGCVLFGHGFFSWATIRSEAAQKRQKEMSGDLVQILNLIDEANANFIESESEQEVNYWQPGQ
jgi:hypothetical protein